jgi:hypothetical protein
MNVEIGTETPIFPFWEYLFRNFGNLSLQCGIEPRKVATSVLAVTPVRRSNHSATSHPLSFCSPLAFPQDPCTSFPADSSNGFPPYTCISYPAANPSDSSCSHHAGISDPLVLAIPPPNTGMSYPAEPVDLAATPHTGISYLANP